MTDTNCRNVASESINHGEHASVGGSQPQSLSDSPEFQEFWRNLGVPSSALAGRRQLLEPVCGIPKKTSKADLKKRLDCPHAPDSFSDHFLFIEPGLLHWGPDRVNAIAFEPFKFQPPVTSDANSESTRAQEAQEVQGGTFSSVDGKTVDVFFGAKAGVSYAGTYNCYHARDWFPKGVRIPSDSISAKDRTAMPMCPTGELKVDCMVLEWTGYNHDLHDKLMSDGIARTGDASTGKRKAKRNSGKRSRKKVKRE